MTAAASHHAQDMAEHNYFDHQSPDGRSPFQRMEANGCRFVYAGENIAMDGSEPEAYNALYHSPEHRDNILNLHYTRVGIGIAEASDGTLLFVRISATRPRGHLAVTRLGGLLTPNVTFLAAGRWSNSV